MNFIGRKEELTRIRDMLNTRDQSVALLYGRRRVGKTELLQKAMHDSGLRGIYSECRESSEASNTEALSEIISDVFGIPGLSFSSFPLALKFLFEQATTEPLIVIIDEYPFLRNVVAGCDSELQVLIDTYRNTSSLKLFLSGSYIETMKQLMSYDNPLYGRADVKIDLQPMDYFESSLFYPSFSPEDKVRLYSVFGGIPYYNQMISEKKSVRQNLIDLLVKRGATLENEVDIYLQGELSKLENANEAFSAIAKGKSRFSDILSQSHIESSSALSAVLDRLTRMGVVEKLAPINDPSNKRKTGYYIADNMTLFHYKYLFRYSSQRAVMDPDVFFDRYIASDFEEQFVPKQFEVICKQYLIRQNRTGNPEEPFWAIGKYYYDLPAERRNGEFDVVTEDDRGYTFYEVKFRKAPVTAEMVREEIEQVNATGLNCYRYAFFSRSGFAGDVPEDIIKIELKDLYTKP